MTTLQGSRILVVGATGGLGSAISRLLADRGAELALGSRAAARATALGLAGSSIAADLTTPDGPKHLVDEAVAALGGLDGIVNASGVVAFGPATEIEDGTLEQLLAVNLLAPIRLLRAAAASLRESAATGRSPFVVNFPGVVAEQPTAGMSAYSAVKSALAAFDTASARELRRDGIRILDARPGHTETGLAGRPISGTAPKMPQGLDPDEVAARVILAIENDEKDLPSSAFA